MSFGTWRFKSSLVYHKMSGTYPDFCYSKDMSYEKELDVALSIAKEAGDVMRQYFYADQGREIKQDGTPLTIADTKINQMVIEHIAREFPNDGVIGEEASTAEYGEGRRWICDPIDGTRAFTWGVPTAMFSLALVIDGVPTVGVCYEPMLDRMYTAIKGAGAFCNDERLQVSSESLMTGIVVTTSNHKKIRYGSSYFGKLIDQNVDLAAFSGAVAKIVRIAEGRLVGYVEELVSAYDVAAAQVILIEAGGKITGLDGEPYDYTKPFNGTIASNGIVHDELVEMIGENQ